MSLNIWSDLARSLGAFAAAALVASFIVGIWAVNAGSVETALLAVGYFVLGEVLSVVAWLAWSKR